MELKSIIEALLFAAPKALSIKEIQKSLKAAAAEAPNEVTERFQSASETEIREALDMLSADYERNGRSFVIQEIGGNFQLGTRHDFGIWVGTLFEGPKPARLSQPALETLAIIAYRQPVSRADMEAVRGVAVDGVVATLLERKLIKIAGRADVPGRALLYETTPEFLEHFGLKNLSELPNADELRRLDLKASSPSPEQPELINETAEPAEADRSVGSPAAEASQPADEASS